MIEMHSYKGYKLTVRESQQPPVAVFDTRWPRHVALYRADSLVEAKRWVDAYERGSQWAVEAKLSAKEEGA